MLRKKPNKPEATALKEIIDADDKQSIVNRITTLLEEYYVFPDQVNSLTRSVGSLVDQQGWEQEILTTKFAKLLTGQLHAVVLDGHLGVVTGLPEESDDPVKQHVRELIRNEQYQVENHWGIRELKVLKNNIGYFSVDVFLEPSKIGWIIDAAMTFLKTTEALIIDLRSCGGGHGPSVNYLLSYFFDNDQPTSLLETYFRPTSFSHLSLTSVTPFHYSKPVYVIVSNKTFSAAEHFAFAIQVTKRGEVVGHTTGGGAHPVMVHPLPCGLYLRIPIGRTFNPETGEDWEGRGVTPDIPVGTDKDALVELMVMLDKNPK